jgi:hypothetical protein
MVSHVSRSTTWLDAFPKGQPRIGKRGENRNITANVPNHSEIANTTEHHFARLWAPIAARVEDHELASIDGSV